MTEQLGSHDRDTVRKLFEHPTSENIEWRQVKSLLESVGTATEEADGALKVTLGGETELFHRPHGKDIDEQMIVDLRRMLTSAGIGPESRS